MMQVKWWAHAIPILLAAALIWLGGCSPSESSGAGAAGSGGPAAGNAGAAGTAGGAGGTAGAAGAAAGSGGMTDGGSEATIPDGGAPTYGDVQAWISAYKSAHSGNGGKDWDINAKTDEEIASDPDLQRLISLCGDGQRPVIPLLAWEYGGADHAWIHPEASALVYCVYIPVNPSTAHWQYDSGQDKVTADVYVKFPDQNPCKTETGANQVMACLGDPSNIEILVDVASLNDGAGAGLMLANAAMDLYLIQPDETRVLLYQGL
ncbi:MAG: hypothetical protein HY898_05465 [Deltaproteobacteria bacterium]|nr:hypothetical protein [Deltaproteobacteria bacterium]